MLAEKMLVAKLIATWRDQPGMLGLRYGFLTDPMKSFGKNGQVMQNSGIGDAAGFRRSAAFVNDLSNAEDELASVHQAFAVVTIHRASTISGNSLASRPRKPLTRTMPTVRPSLSLKSISA